jgi:ketosteroid isomerase-like protein
METNISSNKALVKHLLEAFRTGDLEFLSRYLSTDVEMTTHDNRHTHNARLHQDIANVVRYFDKLMRVWKVSELELHAYTERENNFAILGRVAGSFKQSGRSFDIPWVLSVELDTMGRIKKLSDFIDVNRMFYA